MSGFYYFSIIQSQENLNEFKEHIETNKKAWNKRTPIHIKSNFYNNNEFMKGGNSLKLIELNAIGDVKEK